MSDNSDSDISQDDMELEYNPALGSIISVVGPSAHDCGYCKGKDCSISFGIWAHVLSCAVTIPHYHFLETCTDC